MSVRKRTWKAAEGVEKTAWVVNYTDQVGKRRLKTFDKKKAADDFEATVRNEVRAGVHTPDSTRVTVGEAGDRWIAACESVGLEPTTIDAYRSHLNLHIKPFLGARKLSQLTAPMIADFERKLRDGTETQKPRSMAMVKRVRSDLGALLANARKRDSSLATLFAKCVRGDDEARSARPSGGRNPSCALVSIFRRRRKSDPSLASSKGSGGPCY